MTDTNLSLNPALVLPLAGSPRYRALADRIAEAVESGRLAAGEQLPPVRELAFRLGIGPGAVARAYRIGIERGQLEATVGRGTFVRQGERSPFHLDALLSTAEPETIDLRGNQAVDVGQNAEIGAALQRLLIAHGGAPPLLGYRRREDDLGSIATLAGWLREGGVPAETERLLVTMGAQVGVVASLSILSRGGSGIVLTGETMHPGLIDGAEALKLRLEPVAGDGEGLLPDALDAAIQRHRPDALQISPTLHNPTMSLMGEERRQEIAAVLRRHALPVVEDDVYGRLLTPHPVSFATLTPELCWYVTGFSKCVAAGVRAGLVLTPPGRMIPTLRGYQALAHQTSWLIKALAAELVTGGEAALIEARVKKETRRRSALAAEALSRFGARTHPAASFAYLPLPDGWTAAEFLAATAAVGVLVPPPMIYQVARNLPPFTRIALGGRVSEPALIKGLHRVAQILGEGPHPADIAT
ncbi:MAG: PLP-dependent aminotransferase family protein [Pseudomonadota bacterium]